MDPNAPLTGAYTISVPSAVRNFGRAPAVRSAAPPAPPAPPVRKALRGRKQRQPRADAVDPQLVVARSAAPPAAPASPAVSTPSRAPLRVVDAVVDTGVSIPPDTAGAVSDRFILTATNSEVWIQDRGTENLLSQMSLDDFWSGLGVQGTFDPKVLFDAQHGRFVFVAMSDAQSPSSSLLIGITRTDDPTGDWELGRVQVQPGQGPVWLDYPSVGITGDKITVNINLFTIAGNQFAGSATYCWDKLAFFTPPHTQTVDVFDHTGIGGTLAPAVTLDMGVDDQYLIQAWSGDAGGVGYLAVYRIAGLPGTGPSFKRLGYLQVPGSVWGEFASAGDLGPQAGTNQRIDTGDDRITGCAYANGALFCSHTIYLSRAVRDRTAVQWLEIAPDPIAVTQSGRIDSGSADESYGYSSIAANAQGDVLVGLAVFSVAAYASGGYALRSAADAPGVMHPVHVYAGGASTYHKTFGGHANRWGDYSASQVDPAQPSRFWTVQEFASPTPDTWATRWAQV